MDLLGNYVHIWTTKRKTAPIGSHLLRNKKYDFNKTGTFVNMSNKKNIIHKVIFKYHIEVEIYNIKVGTLVYGVFPVLTGVYLPRWRHTRIPTQGFHILLQLMVNFKN